MGQLLESAIQFLNDGGWQFTSSEDGNWASLYYTGTTGSWLSWFQDRGSALVTYAVCPIKAPVDRLAAVSEVISRANAGLGVGNFELNFDDGTVRYKSGIYAGDEQLSVTMVGHSFFITNSTLDDYLPAIMGVMYGDIMPQLAVARVEEAIQLRRTALNFEPSPIAEAHVDDGPETDTGLMNEELETLLATLSSGFVEPGSGENHALTENLDVEGLANAAQVELEGDAP